MARRNQIEDGVKVTLYLPSKVVEKAKKFADSSDTSLSRLVAECLIERMTGDVSHNVSVSGALNDQLTHTAKAQGVSVELMMRKLLEDQYA